ncbi:MAG: bifunctional folylpolyglutamate synthase/dihydrofolate synthase [Candidatus Sumerlaeaceae bacterium]|nr:bifunctional folylpolyglutamate synthase/dihydrofolate synthase [Candidatus Sumerlaeaceae bacterium]
MKFEWSTPPTYEQVEEFFSCLIDYERAQAPQFRSETKESDLERFRNMLAELAFPQFAAPAFHVAGTKGKGSTCAILASILRFAGLKVGLYTSPHLESYCERLRVNEEPISPHKFAEIIKSLALWIKEHRGDAAQNFRTVFELLTAAAFLYFRESGVDVSVIETGLGGRLDATNVFQVRSGCLQKPLINIITSIGYDHTETLGSTIEEIAAQKAGIIQPHAAVVVAPQPPAHAQTVRRIISHKAASVQCQGLFFADDLLKVSELSSHPATLPKPFQKARFALSPESRDMAERSRLGQALADGLELELSLPGTHQLDNLRTALVALLAAEQVGLKPVDPQAVLAGVRNVKWPGRFEILSYNPPVVVDGAHCELSTRAMAETFCKLWSSVRPHVVFGLMRDKNIYAILQALEMMPQPVQFYCCAPPSPRARHAEEVAATVQKVLQVPASTHISPAEAVSAAWENLSREGGALVCFGSFYLLAPCMKALKSRLPGENAFRE